MDITPEFVRCILDYDPETGVMVWRERPLEMFSRDSDHMVWNKRFAGKQAGGIGAYGYWIIMIKPRPRMAHRLAWAHHYGEWPSKFIDHINGDRTDNRIANLRDVSPVENGRNAHRSLANKSGVTGVFWREDISRWSAYITDNRKRTYLGTFKTFEDAVVVRKAAEQKIGFHENHGRA